MGMYTQIRGWLNVISIGRDEALTDLEKTLKDCRHSFQEAKEFAHLNRRWAAEHAWFQRGGNGAGFIFIGTELENYDSSFEEWLKYLLSHFPTAEGRIDIQYEEENREERDPSRVVLIRAGAIIEDKREPCWTKGYGNGMDLNRNYPYER